MGAREERGKYWRRMEARAGEAETLAGAWRRVLVRQKLQPARGGACDAVSGRSWLGFALDWLFCLSMPFLWQLNVQNVDIRVLQVLWA